MAVSPLWYYFRQANFDYLNAPGDVLKFKLSEISGNWKSL